MATKAEDEPGSFDTVKLAFAGVLLALALGGFSFYSEFSLLYRVLGLLAVIAVATAIALTTVQGRALMAFLSESRTEVRKVVWPSRTETIQTTVVVFVMVIVVGVFLWLLDLGLGWLTRLLIG